MLCMIFMKSASVGCAPILSEILDNLWIVDDRVLKDLE